MFIVKGPVHGGFFEYTSNVQKLDFSACQVLVSTPDQSLHLKIKIIIIKKIGWYQRAFLSQCVYFVIM